MMSLSVCGLLTLLGVIFAAMIVVGLRWCVRARPAAESDQERTGAP